MFIFEKGDSAHKQKYRQYDRLNASSARTASQIKVGYLVE